MSFSIRKGRTLKAVLWVFRGPIIENESNDRRLAEEEPPLEGTLEASRKIGPGAVPKGVLTQGKNLEVRSSAKNVSTPVPLLRGIEIGY